MTAGVLEVEGGATLRGRVRVPGDKSISHRALLLAAQAEGRSHLTGLSNGDDVARTAAAVGALGADVEGGSPGTVHVAGGRARLHEPEGVIDVGNSATGIRLLAGFVASFDWLTVLQGDASVARRPMARVVDPLRRMGARIDGREGGTLPPLVVRGGGLMGIDYAPPVASAQVKSAVLLAGLGAQEDTVVREPVLTRTHTEELLSACGAKVEVSPDGHGQVVRLRPSTLSPLTLEVPGDPSHAAFWVVAASIVPGSEVVVERVYVGPGRSGFLDVLDRMGAAIELQSRDATTADIVARHASLRGTEVTSAEIPGLVDEVPVLAVAAAMAEGETTFRGLAELRVKESDRVATVGSELSALGARVETVGDDLVVVGGTQLRGTSVRSHGDHRVAMAMAVAGMAAQGRTTVEGWDAVATSYPGFVADLGQLT
ncbi:MAG TPA: 3-phosphoshikimate 1-carboxyvinyltransferase [Acidimicrobiales bacterium]|nr:3-phosphoshikimate 1-carboxyvinyltransferase [Acidimicrobiales bacterium]